MSMNLSCEWMGNEFPLLQTPTQITNMCMVQPNGEVPWELTGKKAKHALQIYCQWRLGSTNGVWNNIETLEEARRNISDGISNIQKIIKSEGKLVVRKI